MHNCQRVELAVQYAHVMPDSVVGRPTEQVPGGKRRGRSGAEPQPVVEGLARRAEVRTRWVAARCRKA